MNLEALQDQPILFLGKPRAFSQEEFAVQVARQGITLLKECTEDICFVLEGRMMTPFEQNLVEELYEKGGYTFIGIDSFEEALAQKIDDATLLMSLKLSNDTERLESFLKNSAITDRLFFKLLRLYKWDGEDFFENDANRDVTAALIGRFYENIERNHNVQYATTGLLHLVAQTQRTDLLEAISQLEPSTMHPKLMQMIAQHPNTPESVLERFIAQGDPWLLEAVSKNEALSYAVVVKLAQDPRYASIVARLLQLTPQSFALLHESYGVELGYNQTLTSQMQEVLLQKEDSAVKAALATNPVLDYRYSKEILKEGDPALLALLYAHQKLTEEEFIEAYAQRQYHSALASNPATPQPLLQKLYEEADADVLEALASNEATPVDLLYQLQLDSRFERFVKKNSAFAKHIQSNNIGWL